jgi:hypothetical protein
MSEVLDAIRKASGIAKAQIPAEDLPAHYAAAEEYGKKVDILAHAGEGFTTGSGATGIVSPGHILIEICPGGPDMVAYWIKANRAKKTVPQ